MVPPWVEYVHGLGHITARGKVPLLFMQVEYKSNGYRDSETRETGQFLRIYNYFNASDLFLPTRSNEGEYCFVVHLTDTTFCDKGSLALILTWVSRVSQKIVF